MTGRGVGAEEGAARGSAPALVTTLTVAMASAVLLQVVFGALGPFLTADLGLSRTRLGLLTTTLYMTGAGLSPIAGRVVDRLGTRAPLLALFLITIASTVAVAAAPGFTAILPAALVGGIAVALGNPVTNTLVAVGVPADRQGLATGIKQSGVQLGVFVGGAGLPPIAELAGWRTATLAAVAVPLIGLWFASRVVGPTEAGRPAGGPAVGPTSLPPGTGWLVAYAAGMGIGIAAMGAYLPLFGVERLGFPPSLAGLLTAVLGGVGVLARIAWGRAADRSSARPSGALAIMGVLAVLAAVLIVLSGARGPGLLGALLAWGGAIVAGTSAAAWNAVGMLAIIRDAPVRVAGRASGVVLLSFYGGFVAGPTLFGVLVDATGSYQPAWALVGGVFACSLLVALGWRRRERSAHEQVAG